MRSELQNQHHHCIEKCWIRLISLQNYTQQNSCIREKIMFLVLKKRKW